jgi:hypothetical protein
VETMECVKTAKSSRKVKLDFDMINTTSVKRVMNHAEWPSGTSSTLEMEVVIESSGVRILKWVEAATVVVTMPDRDADQSKHDVQARLSVCE